MAILKFFLVLLCAILIQNSVSASFDYKASFSSAFHIEQLQRLKRETPSNSSVSKSNSDHDNDACVVKCLRSTEEKLGALQEDDKKSQDQSNPLSPQSALSRDYDPKDFQKLCDAYRPGRECLNACDTTDLKNAAIKGMGLLQFMCVDKYEEFKANLPCMNNASAEAELACKPNCSEFESSVARLEELSSNRDLVVQLTPQQLSSVLGGSCQYVDCLSRCGSPLTEKKCGKDVALLDEELVKHVFNSLRNTVTALGAGDQLPKACSKLGGK